MDRECAELIREIERYKKQALEDHQEKLKIDFEISKMQREKQEFEERRHNLRR